MMSRKQIQQDIIKMTKEAAGDAAVDVMKWFVIILLIVAFLVLAK